MIIGVVLGRLHVLLTFLDGSSIIRLNNFKDCRSHRSAVKKVGAVNLVAVLGIFCGKAIGTGAAGTTTSPPEIMLKSLSPRDKVTN